MKLQLILSKILSFLGNATDESLVKGEDGLDVIIDTDKNSYYMKIIKPVVDIIDAILLPIIIVLGVAGSIYGIVLGVQMSRAENSDKRGEIKKRLINGAIGIVVMLILLILMKLLSANADDIAEWITSVK